MGVSVSLASGYPFLYTLGLGGGVNVSIHDSRCFCLQDNTFQEKRVTQASNVSVCIHTHCMCLLACNVLARSWHAGQGVMNVVGNCLWSHDL